MKYSFQLGSNVFGLVVERSVTISEPLNKHVNIQMLNANSSKIANDCYHATHCYYLLLHTTAFIELESIWTKWLRLRTTKKNASGGVKKKNLCVRYSISNDHGSKNGSNLVLPIHLLHVFYHSICEDLVN